MKSSLRDRLFNQLTSPKRKQRQQHRLAELLEPRTLFSTTTVTPTEAVTTGRITGTLFADYNLNAAWDAGDGRNAGWTVYLDSNNNAALDTGELRATTNVDGNFAFENLAPGTYIVRQVLQAGWRRVVPISADFNNVNVTAGTTSNGGFGNAPLQNTLGRVAGTVWADMNNNASWDAGDQRLSGWTIYSDANNNARHDYGERFTTTDLNGNFNLANLPPGQHTIRQILKDGWQRKVPASSDNWIVNITGGGVASAGFGNAPLAGTLARITGTLWSDMNSNGAWDAGDGRLEGWQVYLDLNNNGKLDSSEPATLTNSYGGLSFNNVIPGQYVFRQILQQGWRRMVPAAADYWTLNVANGQTVSTGFGNAPLPVGFGTVSGTLWSDMNNSNAWDYGDGRLIGWRVYVDNNNNGAFDTGELSAFTNSVGGFTIANVPSGARYIRQVVEPGWRRVVPSGDSWLLSIIPNETAYAGFGNAVMPGAALIEGSVFNDVNANGQWDTGDQRAVGRLVYLDTNDNAAFDAGEISAVTDNNGAYLFPVAAGSYKVRTVLPGGWRLTYPKDEDNYTFNLASGANVTATFGTTQAVSVISGNAFQDLNGNSMRDAGDAGLANWAVYVDSNNNAKNDLGERWVTTDASGNFAFTGLPAGSYRVRLIDRYNWSPTLGAASAVAVVNGSSTVNGLSFGTRQLPEPDQYAPEKIVSWFTIGGSSTVAADRNVGWNIKTLGWQGFVSQYVVPQIAWGVKRILIHNPFGTLNGENFQADQAIEAREAGLTWLTNNFVEAWSPITAQGIEVIVYVGAPRNDEDFTSLAPAAWWARFWESMDLPMRAGMNIGLDQSLGAQVTDIDWLAVEELRNRGHIVYGEPRPAESTPHWRETPLIAEDYMWQYSNPELNPSTMYWAAKDSQITGEVTRAITRPPAGQTWATQGQWIVGEAHRILRDGHTVSLSVYGLIQQGITMAQILG